MRRWCRKLFRLLPLLVLIVTMPCAEVGAQTNYSTRQKLKQAGQVADRLIERFHETLNFDPVFDQFFVTEPALRQLSVALGDEKKLQGKISESVAERNFKAVMTFMHLFAEYRLTSDKEIPAEIEQAISSSKIFSSSANDEEKYPATVAEMDRTLAELDRASSLFRTYFAPGIFQSRTYLDNIAKERQRAKEYSHNVPRVEWGNQKHGIKANTPVYVVRRELFDYYFIEEKGAFKLFYVDLFPNFKLTF